MVSGAVCACVPPTRYRASRPHKEFHRRLLWLCLHTAPPKASVAVFTCVAPRTILCFVAPCGAPPKAPGAVFACLAPTQHTA
eukprot:6106753-Pyramimonas_sp.AAC.1